MIFDFTRFYPNLQSWLDLEGSTCSLCKLPLRIGSDGATVYPRDHVKCDTCNWKLDFYADQYGCNRPYIFHYKGFDFCRGASRNPVLEAIDVLYVRYADPLALWEPLLERVGAISLYTILQMIRTGELRGAIRQAQIKHELKLKAAQELKLKAA